MLPSPAEFDQYLAVGENALVRAGTAAAVGEALRELTIRAGRARALALLDLYDSLPPRRRYHEIALRTGISVSRVQQLLADGRMWREYDARDAVEAAAGA